MKNEEPMRNINPFGLRLQPELKARLEEAAKKNKRSLNAEISARLESTFPAPGTSFVPPKIAEQFAQIDSALLAALREKVWLAIDEAITEAAPPPKAAPTPKKPAHKIKWDTPDKK